MDIQARIDKWVQESGATLDDAQCNRLFYMVENVSDDAYSDGYEDGVSDGMASARRDADEVAQQTIDEYTDQIEAALQLVDTDRAAAKVYLDRAYSGLSFAIPKQGETPCLL